MPHRRRFLRTSCFLALAAALGLPSPARAADATAGDLTELSLEQLMEVRVYAASRHDQTASEAPSSVTVVTAEEIRRYGWRTFSDLLRSVRGVFASYDRIYHYVGVRGFAPPGDQNTKILFLVDGHRVNDDIYNQGYVGEDFVLDLDLVKRVEVVRGPSSSLYGTNAFFAVVNVITRRGEDFGGAEVSADASSFDAYRGRLSYGKRFAGGADLVLSGSLYHSKGDDLYFREFDAPETNGGGAEGIDGERVKRAFGAFSLYGVTLEAAFVSRKKDVPTSSYGAVFPDKTNRSDDDTFFAEARFDRPIGETSVFARLFYDGYRFKGRNTVEDPETNPTPPNRVLLLDEARDQALGAEAKLSRTFFERHTVTVGGEYRDVYQLEQHTYTDEPPSTALDADRPFQTWAFYAQAESRLAPGLLFNAGLRYDHYSTFGGTTNPRAALIWTPLEPTTFKLLYGQAFRAPNAYELYWNDGGLTQKANPDLRPEKIRTYEAVWEQALGPYVRSIVSGYYYTIKNLLSTVNDPADGLDMFENTGSVDGYGAELELAGRWASGVEGRLSYAWQRGEDRETRDELPNFPRHAAKANLSVPVVAKKLFASLEAQYLSRREPAEPHHTPSKAHTVVNATLYGRELLPGLEVSASVYNLFNEPYSDLGGSEHEQELLRQDGRTFRLKLTYGF